MARKKDGKKGMPNKQANDNKTVESGMPRQKIVWMSLAGFLFIISIVSILYAYGVQKEIEAYDENLTNCSMELDNIQQEINVSRNEITALQRDLENKDLTKAMEKVIKDRLNIYQTRNMSHPITQIQSDLIQNQSLIPYKSTEGKLLRFMFRHQIYVLSPTRVLAIFGDGSVSGWLYLNYNVDLDGEITWKVIDSYCPECKRQ